MLLNCDVLRVVSLPLPTARPIKQFVPKEVLVMLPTLVHEEPSALLNAVMVVPLRTRRTQVLGTVPVLLLVVLVLPPVAVRRTQR